MDYLSKSPISMSKPFSAGKFFIQQDITVLDKRTEKMISPDGLRKSWLFEIKRVNLKDICPKSCSKGKSHLKTRKGKNKNRPNHLVSINLQKQATHFV